jgi:hypothetical protein
MDLECAEKVECFKGTGLLKQQHANLSVSVHHCVVHSIRTHPNPVAALTESVVEFLSDDSNGDLVLQQSERSDEPGWPTTSLLHHAVSTLVLSIESQVKETYYEYRRVNRRRHGSATERRVCSIRCCTRAAE